MKGVGDLAVGRSCQLSVPSGTIVGGLRADVHVLFVCLLCLPQILFM